MLYSLPIGRGTVVWARYLVAIAAGGLAGIAGAATGSLLLPFLDSSRNTPGSWISLQGVLTFVIAVGLLVSFLFPLYFRYGMGKGAMASLGMSVGLLALGHGTAGLAGGPGQPSTAPPEGLPVESGGGPQGELERPP